MDFSNLGDWAPALLFVLYYLFSALKNRAANKSQKPNQDDLANSDEQASRNIREEIARKIAQRQGRLAQQPKRVLEHIGRPLAKTVSCDLPSAPSYEWDAIIKMPSSAAYGPILIEKASPSIVTACAPSSLSSLRSRSALRQAIIHTEIFGKPRGLIEWNY